MNILIAEDQPISQFLNRRLMGDWGFEYDLASDGIEAVAYAQKNEGRYDLCIMDVEMPRMNGIEALAAIRSKVRYFPIMALTTDERFRTGCLEAGVDEFALKPCAPASLLSKIHELTIRFTMACVRNAKVSLWQEKPMNAEQLKELRELDKQGLALLIVENGTQRFVVHKNIQNKMSHVLIGEGKELFEFLDRGENPANCHLYKSNMQSNRLLLTPEQFKERAQQEDRDIGDYMSPVDKGFGSEDNE